MRKQATIYTSNVYISNSTGWKLNDEQRGSYELSFTSVVCSTEQRIRLDAFLTSFYTAVKLIITAIVCVYLRWI